MTSDVLTDTLPVTLTTTDGVRIDVGCAPGTDVLAAAAEAGYVLPSLCRKGTCGACYATVEGAHDVGPHSAEALPPGAAADGGALLCRTYPREPLAVALRCEDSRIIRGSIPERGADVVVVEPVSPDGRTVRVRLHLDPDDVSGAGVEFEPGQFVEVSLPGQEPRRAYSLANVANWDGEVELLVRLQPGGWFSGVLEGWLATGPAGARLVVHGPQGAFGLRENGIRPRWLVAGGTGLAPLASMVRRMAEWGDPQPVRLYLGVTTAAELPDLALLPELAEALDLLPGAVLEPCVWRPDGTWTGTAGTPVDALARDLAVLGGTAGPGWPDVYVCGPPALVDAACAAAAAAGVPADQVHAEKYLPA